jgi:hypothetical protein
VGVKLHGEIFGSAETNIQFSSSPVLQQQSFGTNLISLPSLAKSSSTQHATDVYVSAVSPGTGTETAQIGVVCEKVNKNIER